MGTQTNQTCERSIDFELEARMRIVRGLLAEFGWINRTKNDMATRSDIAAYFGVEDSRDADWTRACYEWVLSAETDDNGSRRVLLSWGGPADWFEFKGQRGVIYDYQDWGDNATRQLCDTDAKFVRILFEPFLRKLRGTRNTSIDARDVAPEMYAS